MSEQAQISVDSSLCNDAQALFADMGTLGVRRCGALLENGTARNNHSAIYRVPNQETLAAMQELESGGGYRAHSLKN